MLVNGFGRISEVSIGNGITIDNGHLIAFTEGLEYEISKAGGGWISSMMSGEGLVMKFRGQGKILVQSHDRVGLAEPWVLYYHQGRANEIRHNLSTFICTC